MNVYKLILVAKKCLGEARWSRHEKLSDKWQVFIILLRLRYFTEFSVNNSRPVKQSIFGFQVTGSSFNEILYLFREIFLEFQYHLLIKTDTLKIIDGGANIGMAILFFKKFHPHCKILAFEPNPVIFGILKKNVEENKLKDVEIINAGLGDETGTMDFYVDPDNSLISSVLSTRGGSQRVRVDCVKLSHFVKDHSFDFAKIDIEGAEWKVINELNEAKCLQNIHSYLFEYHHNISSPTYQLSDFLKVFEQNGFSYNMKATYWELGDFQDIAINFYKPQ